jgi:hypothetical protein
MRFASVICLAMSMLGCSENSTPRPPTTPTPSVTTPSPTPSPRETFPEPQSNLVAIWGYVVTPGGDCIEGATVEVVGGPILVGQKTTQRTPCDFARFGGGFMFDEGAHPNHWAHIRLRASAPGYTSEEQILADWPWDLVPTFTLAQAGR